MRSEDVDVDLRHPAAWRGDALFEAPGFRVADAAGRIAAVGGLVELGAEIRATLEEGCGAVLLSGAVAPGGDGPEDARVGEAERAFDALARAVGTPVSQDPEGRTLLRVEDRAYGRDDPRVRGPHTNKRLSFHTDRCDVIGFCCVRDARAGGENELISSMALFAELRARAPELLDVLCGNFVYLRHTVDTGNERPWTEMPVFSSRDGHFAASLLRVLIDRADAHPDLPSLSDAQRAALDALEEVAEDSSLKARFRLAPGDCLFVNNWVLMHRRSAFEDHADPERRRLLLRTWLSVPDSRPLDPRFAEHFGAVEAGALRGGMRSREDPPRGG